MLEYAYFLIPLTGLILWLRLLHDGRLRAWLQSPGLMPRWEVSGTDFMVLVLCVAALVITFPVVLAVLGRLIFDTASSEARATLAGGMGMQLGGLVAWFGFWTFHRDRPRPETAPLSRALLVAVAGFFLALPVLTGLLLGWSWTVETLGIEAPPQPIIDYIRAAESPVEVGLWIAMAVVVAPITEELVLRAGLFRFLAMRMKPVTAALYSSAVFGLMHGNLHAFIPLMALGFVLALVYHRTGRIGASILLHALFNANSMLVILLTQNS